MRDGEKGKVCLFYEKRRRFFQKRRRYFRTPLIVSMGYLRTDLRSAVCVSCCPRRNKCPTLYKTLEANHCIFTHTCERESNLTEPNQTPTSRRRTTMEEGTKSIQHEIGGVYTDALRFGFHGVKSDILEVHPLQSATQSAKKIQQDMNKKVLANNYGSAFPIKFDLDHQILTRFLFFDYLFCLFDFIILVLVL
ncbi:hypothetical protein RND81_10G050600 [Saponaria officinalis]|uniref:Uncharacterized protein n=1 Tax=Saponaria officinalis TaxID=3572 RepID=A0AAW1HYU6_SAPOF